MLNFVDLEVRAAGLAGYHTGLRQFVGSDFLHDVAVFQHETIHDEIFSETPDGILHVLILRKAAAAELEDERARSTAAASRLLAETRFAHEVGATYVGIQALATELERTRTYDRLTEDYRSYYDFLNQIVSRSFSSVIARHAIGLAMVRWAFSSPRITSLSTVDRLGPEGPFWSIPGPDARLRSISSVMTSMGPEALRQSFATQMITAAAGRAVAGVELTDDATWNSQDLTTLGKLDGLSTRAAWTLIPTITSLPALTRFRLPEFLRDVSREVDVRWYETASVRAAPTGDVARHMARKASRRRIRRRTQPFTSGDERFAKFLPTTLRGGRATVFIVALPFAGDNEYVVRWSVDHDGERASGPPTKLHRQAAACLMRHLYREVPEVAVCLVYVAEDWTSTKAEPFPSDVLIPMHAFRVEELCALKGELKAGITCSILAYARAEWAHVIGQKRGTLLVFDVYLGPMQDEDTTSLVLMLFTEPKSSMHATGCLVSKIDFGNFRPLIDLAVESGRITLDVIETGFAFHELFDTLWNTLESL